MQIETHIEMNSNVMDCTQSPYLLSLDRDKTI